MYDISLIEAYPQNIKDKVLLMLKDGRLKTYINTKYTEHHNINNNKELFNYVKDEKSRYLKKSSPLHNVYFDDKIERAYNALGLKVKKNITHGSKIKSKNEIIISSVFKNAPLAFLEMIVIHELSHLKYQNHDKRFYALCCNILPDYHQLEFYFRLYCILKENQGAVTE